MARPRLSLPLSVVESSLVRLHNRDFSSSTAIKKKKKYACQTHSFSIHLGVGREQASVNKNNLRAMLYTPLRRVHARIHSPWYALAKCREFPAATNFSPGTVFGQLTATRNARTASPAWVHFTFAFSARIDASTFAEDFACICFCT